MQVCMLVYICVYICIYICVFMCVCVCVFIYTYIYVCMCVCVCIYIYIYIRLIGLVGRVFTSGSGDLGSIPGRVIPKTLKMLLDTSLLNTQQYKVCIQSKVEQSRERSSALPYT